MSKLSGSLMLVFMLSTKGVVVSLVRAVSFWRIIFLTAFVSFSNKTELLSSISEIVDNKERFISIVSIPLFFQTKIM